LTLGNFADNIIIDLDVQPVLLDVYYLEDLRRLEVAFRSDAGYELFGFALYKINCLIKFLLG
jgi:hypothetical protein